MQNTFFFFFVQHSIQMVALLCISHIYLELRGSIISLKRYVLAFTEMWLFKVNGRNGYFFFWVKETNSSNSSGKSEDSYNQTRVSRLY